MRLKPKQIFGGLWEPQKGAIQECEKYLTRKDQTTAFLVRMPTGTGKTGVIAHVARCRDADSNILVLTPWAHLRDQVGRAVVPPQEGSAETWTTFWERLGITPPFERRLVHLFPSKMKALTRIRDQKGLFIVSTISALQRIFARDDKVAYDYLKEVVDTAIVDEGHYEPAALWAQSIRGLEVPTILLTATPYRNDFKLFRVRDSDTYEFTHDSSENAGFIRPIRFVSSVKPNPRSPHPYKEFVDELIRYTDRELEAASNVKEARVIIRCDRDHEIVEIAGYLNRMNKKVIGVHDTFLDDRSSYLRKKVPDPRAVDAQYWVHQHKLTEGLDDSRFALLAIYSRFRNQRALVQQIGRILRVTRPPTRSVRSNETAIVFAPAEMAAEESWRRYRTYEKGRTGKRSETLEILESMLSKQPVAEYFAGRFRERFDIDDPSAHEKLIYRLSARIARTGPGFDWNVFKETVFDELSKQDRIIRNQVDYAENARIWIYALAGNSPHLREHALVEIRLGFAIAVLHRDLLFFKDTERFSSFAYFEKHTRTLEAKELQRLIPDTGSVAKSVSLKSMLLGQQIVSGRILRGNDIGQSPQALMDNLQVCSTVEATIDSVFRGNSADGPARSRRFVSLGRSRLREHDAPESELDGVTLDTYLSWTEIVSELVKTEGEHSSLFLRYAEPIKAPENPRPHYILLDIEESTIKNSESGEFISEDEVDRAMVVAEDEESGRPYFEVSLQDTVYKVQLIFQADRRRFRLKAKELGQKYVATFGSADSSQMNLVRYLNQNQAFRISLKGANVLYDSGNFYQVNYDLFSKLIDNIVDKPALGDVDSEKGEAKLKSGNRRYWPAGSVFDLIDINSPRCCFREELEGITHMVCDDPAPEAADFIAADLDSGNRVIFIHAKDGKGKKLSAEVFQEICAQAYSKLGYAVAGASQNPAVHRWRDPWRLKGARVARWRKYPKKEQRNGPRAWQRIRSVIDDPRSEKEIWLVLGRSMSREALLEAYSGDQRPHQFMHLAYLLNSTWAAVGEAGARLRIFCGYHGGASN